MVSYKTGRTLEQFTTVKEHFFSHCKRIYGRLFVNISFQLCIEENLLHHETSFYGG